MKIKTWGIINVAAFVSIILAIALLLYVFYLIIFPLKVSEVKSPATVVTKEIHPGEMFIYIREYCNYDTHETTTYKSLVNDIVYDFPPEEKTTEKGCGKDAVQSVRIPMDIQPGKYYLRVRAVHHLNILHDETVTWNTEIFTILPVEE